ncbi:urea ABC transporter substrate-binding protein [Natrarchaeobius oligotrophus]|uniref:Urea ABC transporter substrate-binding protein n=1 Tax=Natrarchaeobius chitinivorans TaxID=1679083 RepID=A0A3N6PKP2_NATCH|nr:urea ABC transporter substrate-binding protein [Natrarchaeobius chitinivorans]RQH01880.1 urea ABC transporter substrate-binding protein [Natrarchaeobius chitinivorans]
MSRSDSEVVTTDVVSRRAVLATGGAGLGATVAGCTDVVGRAAGESEPVTIAVLEDRSGAFEASGTPKWQASRLAIDELNDDGGILGREIKLVDPDPESDDNRYQRLTQDLLRDGNIDALWAGYASSAREAIRPLVNDYEQLYFYTTLYEGGVCDRYTFLPGATARQQLGIIVPYLIEEYGGRIYSIAADYNYGHLSTDWVRVLAAENGGEVIEREYVPLAQDEFGDLLDRIETADPDVVVSNLVGGAHASFYAQNAEREYDVPIGTPLMLGDGAHRQFDPPTFANVYTGVNYMEELPTDRNEAFVERFYDAFPDAAYVSQEAQNNYFSTHLYAQAVEAAGTTDQQAVIEQLETGMVIEAPQGDVEVDGATHHMNHTMRIARCDANHEIEFHDDQRVDETFLSDTVGCDLREIAETRQYTPTWYYREVQ